MQMERQKRHLGHIISNMHKFKMIEVTNKLRKTATKPNIIRHYNQGMSGVDRSD